MADKFTKNTLKIVVAQICQTIGWHHITVPAMEIMVDVLNRTLTEIARTTHSFSDVFGRTRPNLDDLGLAFRELGIDVRELREYVEYVDHVPSNVEVPKFPVPKESHLNFLKPGSQEVVTRPVHVHEHLPPTLELSVDTTVDLTNSPQPSPTFKRPGDPIDVAAKKMRLNMEEEGRALREISSVMMTTGGFISPAREGKLPEPKLALPADVRSSSPPVQHYPSVPPEVNREKKKKAPKEKEAKEKDKSKKKEKHQLPPPVDQHFVQKLVNMKETAKLKALKSKPKPSTPKVITPEKSLIQKLAESPHLVVTPILAEPTQPVAKLPTEPDKQKLNIFKKISKVKEEEPPPQPPPPPVTVKEECGFSSPGSPSTPKTPDIMRQRSPEHKKKKKDKDKEKKKERRKEKEERAKIAELETEKRPKIPEPSIQHMPPSFPFFPPGLIPPVINNPLIPRFPVVPLGPNFPNLPLPPPHFMQPPVKSEPVPETHSEPSGSLPTKSPLALLLDKKGKDHHKKDKKDKKKKDRKDKPKKDKKEKKHPEEKHKEKRDKKEKKEKRKEKEKEQEKEKQLKEVAEASVPKLTIKVTPVEEKVPPKVAPEKRADSPEVARLSALFSKPSSTKQAATSQPPEKPLHVHTDNLKPVKESPLQKSPGTIIDKDGNKVWICPSCGRPDDGTPMIGCDECDAWYHWVCVGIQVPPDENVDWYCRYCIVKKQGSHEKKKRGRKKKPPT